MFYPRVWPYGLTAG